MKFTLEINMDNAAFEGCDSITETQRILIRIAEKIDLFNRFKVGHNDNVFDINGNKVGQWKVTK